MSAAARRLLARLGIDLDPDARVAGLRMGEQQLVEIAKALSLDARILIMDEPTSALSPAECERLFRIVRSLAAEGVGIVYISHRIDEVMDLADRVTVLRDGRHVVTAPIAEMTRTRLISAMVGRDTAAARRPRARPPAPSSSPSATSPSTSPAATAGAACSHGVDFDLHAGEVLGIGGLLGSGRTEILETLFGASPRPRRRRDPPRRPARSTSPRPAPRAASASRSSPRTARPRACILAASIRDNVALPSLGAHLPLRHPPPPPARPPSPSDAVRRLGVRCSGIGQTAATLSGGNQQKVVIGKWLATGPRVLLLDEPTRGIDVGAKQEIYALIRALAAEGLAILMVTSELPELLLLADRILVMAAGPQDRRAHPRRGQRGGDHAPRRPAASRAAS